MQSLFNLIRVSNHSIELADWEHIWGEGYEYPTQFECQMVGATPLKQLGLNYWSTQLTLTTDRTLYRPYVAATLLDPPVYPYSHIIRQPEGLSRNVYVDGTQNTSYLDNQTTTTATYKCYSTQEADELASIIIYNGRSQPLDVASPTANWAGIWGDGSTDRAWVDGMKQNRIGLNRVDITLDLRKEI